MQWGLERCISEGVPAYLESTLEAGPLYSKHGFDVVETVEMGLEARDGKPTTYKEICFLFRPDTTDQKASEQPPNIQVSKALDATHPRSESPLQ